MTTDADDDNIEIISGLTPSDDEDDQRSVADLVEQPPR